MQSKILEILRQANDYVSGEQLSRELGVSRSAVWKNINHLRSSGYVIHSVTNRGYKLCTAPDILSADEIRNGLETLALGKNICALDEVDSTNEEAKRQGTLGAPHGSVFVAERQTGGKGRLGRAWVSPPGTGIWMSVLLRPAIAPSEVPQITLITGLAVCRAIRACTGCEALIKWPNDIVIGSKKVCGILTEMAAEEDRINYIVAGIGINVNTESFPEELAKKATSLFMETGMHISRSALVRTILQELENCYDHFLTEVTADLLTPYRKFCVSLNRSVTVTRGNPPVPVTGTAVDISSNGELVVRTPGGTLLYVNSGEVAVQGIYE